MYLTWGARNMKAFYFATPDRKLRYRDGRAIAVGVTHKHEGAVVLCESGLHAAATPFEALQYAPGPILYLVRLSGTIVQGDDKMAASERTYLAEYDATELLRRYACIQALKQIELIRPYCSERDYSAIMEYLTTGDAALREAAEAAARAARADAGAAGEAARTAARAARAAAGAAARAAWEAAGAAARAATWEECAAEFNTMVQTATGWEF